jgi:23S rRNA (cytidine1920-2'-O)/16S rRNA (cytidine1409-2'-O)-methyltransferase
VPELRNDPRVQVHEGLNVRYLEPAVIGGPVELTVADLSFISLVLVLPALAAATRPGGDLVLMVKPQFEVGRERLSRTGVVTSPEERRRAVTDVAAAALDLGLDLRGAARSPLPGQDGNVEFFMWITVPLSVAETTIGSSGHNRPTEESAAELLARFGVEYGGDTDNSGAAPGQQVR